MGYDTFGKRSRWLEYAKDGDVYAQYELAQSYCCRMEEGKLDGFEALKWWCASAKNGYAKSQVKVGKLYEHQELMKDADVPKDDLRAYAWYKLAKKRGSEEGRDGFLRLRESMTSDQITKAEKLLADKKNIKCGDDAVKKIAPLPTEEKDPKKKSH